MKFIQREERRGNSYDIILTDPPKFGRGTHGEVWQLFDHLPLMPGNPVAQGARPGADSLFDQGELLFNA
jgi:hypothetical protein